MCLLGKIFESESKLRIQNAMSLILKSHSLSQVSVDVCEFDATNFMSQDEDLHNTVVPDILLQMRTILMTFQYQPVPF